MNILYYITSHGYGHAVRTSAICNCFGPDVKVIFRTAVPERFFTEEITAPFTIFSAEFDCGCIQSDGVTVDIEKTLNTYLSIARQNEKRLTNEVEFCKKVGADCIVSDITPFAFEVAYRAGLPSVAVSNFTWFDIYSPYTAKYPWFVSELDRMLKQYCKATMLLSLAPSMEMAYFSEKKEVPIVGRKGKCRKEEIFQHLNIAENKKLGLIYTGNFGLDSVKWYKLEQFSDWEFLGVYPLKDNPKNFHLINKEDFAYQDLSASVDVIICKLGYGVLSESILNSIPLIFLPRTDFAEYPVLENKILANGYGCRLDTKLFSELQWQGALEQANLIKLPEYDTQNSGAQMCARAIEKLTMSLHP